MRVLVLNGPNLGRLGSREPEVYGSTTYDDLVSPVQPAGARSSGSRSTSARPTTRPSWSAGSTRPPTAAMPVVLNPAAFTHYSYALRDACAQLTSPLVEVHITNPAARETFRHTSVISAVATGTIAGFGVDSYRLALRRADRRWLNACSTAAGIATRAAWDWAGLAAMPAGLGRWRDPANDR